MCGIAGLRQRDGTPDADLLMKMARQLAHRGPDDEGVHIDGSVGLAHTRLSIIDLAGGHQPLRTADGRLCLVANGEIYNHLELRTELEGRGHRYLTHSDSEAILHAYVEYGDDFLRHLRGMFVFALYDRLQRRLILARDRLGIKPLFVAQTGHGLAFASEIKALLPALGQAREIHPPALAQFLQCQYSSGPATLLAGVQRLLPGEAMSIDGDGVQRRWRYWSMHDVTPMEIDFAEAAARFDGLIETVMREHMRADVPFGLFLSGGVDSSILLALLSRFKNERIRTLSVGFPGSGVTNELAGAQAMSSRFGSRHRAVETSRDDMLRRLALSTWAADELMLDYASLPTLSLAQAAAAELKVVFTGEGGDESFAGYGRYRIRSWQRWLRSLVAPGASGFRRRGDFRGAWADSMFSAPLQAAIVQWRRPVIEAWEACPPQWSALQRMQAVDMVTALPDNLLVKVDRMLMAHGVEGRVPFLDHRIVEFGLGLPDRLKVRGRDGKVFLKRWAERLLPKQTLWTRKRGFSVPLGEWLRGPYLERLAAVLPQHVAIRTWFRPEGVDRLLRAQREGGHATRQLVALHQFAIWHRLFIEGDGARPDVCDPIDFIA
jgi:asparagine synthase (glutamine-hydrolysing)